MKFFELHTRGTTRLVFLVGSYAIKIPNFTYRHLLFLQGCYANYSERKYYKIHITADYETNMVKYVAPSYFCSWFGLIQIQARCLPNPEWLTDEQKAFYEPLCQTDSKKDNFGYYKGTLVCLDYP